MGKAQQLALEVNFMKLCGEAVALGLAPSKAMGFVDLWILGVGPVLELLMLNGLFFFGRS